MLKQYFSYFLYGFIIFYFNLFIWGFSAGAVDIRPYITLISSISLFGIASVMALYKRKLAAIIGIVSLMGTIPFAVYMISDCLRGKLNLFAGSLIMIILLLFISSLTITLKVLINYKRSLDITAINNYLKLTLTALPIALIAWWIISIFLIR